MINHQDDKDHPNVDNIVANLMVMFYMYNITYN